MVYGYGKTVRHPVPPPAPKRPPEKVVAKVAAGAAQIAAKADKELHRVTGKRFSRGQMKQLVEELTRQTLKDKGYRVP